MSKLVNGVVQFFYFIFYFWSSINETVRTSSPCNAGDVVSVPGSGTSPGEGKSNPLQCSCLENSMDRGAWWATVHGVTESDMTEVT